MVRSIFLRGFDQQIAEMIGKHMEAHNTKIIRPAIPTKIEKTNEGKLRVFYSSSSGETSSGEFDTVLVAIGRKPETKKIGLEKIGLKVDPTTGKIPTVHERTNLPHIYAIGDMILEGLELTPVAIQAGRLLVRRLYGNSNPNLENNNNNHNNNSNTNNSLMDYNNVATTVFTPLEYGCIGLSEENAIVKYGEKNIEVYHTHYLPLEWSLPHYDSNTCYAKLICNKLDKERVVGLHFLGPHAGEVTQGYAVAFKLGATKADFDDTVGIHPTVSEELTTLNITKSSGLSPEKTGC